MECCQSYLLKGLARIKSIVVARKVLLTIPHQLPHRNVGLEANVANAPTCLLCIEGIHSNRIREKNLINFWIAFQEDIILTCLMMSTRSLRIPISKEKMSPMARASYSVRSLVQGNLSLKDKRISELSRSYYTTFFPPTRWVDELQKARCHFSISIE